MSVRRIKMSKKKRYWREETIDSGYVDKKCIKNCWEGNKNAAGQEARVKTNSPISSHGRTFIYMCVKLSENGHVCYTITPVVIAVVREIKHCFPGKMWTE